MGSRSVPPLASDIALAMSVTGRRPTDLSKVVVSASAAARDARAAIQQLSCLLQRVGGATA